jgi:hypothetical protein
MMRAHLIFALFSCAQLRIFCSAPLTTPTPANSESRTAAECGNDRAASSQDGTSASKAVRRCSSEETFSVTGHISAMRTSHHVCLVDHRLSAGSGSTADAVLVQVLGSPATYGRAQTFHNGKAVAYADTRCDQWRLAEQEKRQDGHAEPGACEMMARHSGCVKVPCVVHPGGGLWRGHGSTPPKRFINCLQRFFMDSASLWHRPVHPELFP